MNLLKEDMKELFTYIHKHQDTEFGVGIETLRKRVFTDRPRGHMNVALNVLHKKAMLIHEVGSCILMTCSTLEEGLARIETVPYGYEEFNV